MTRISIFALTVALLAAPEAGAVVRFEAPYLAQIAGGTNPSYSWSCTLGDLDGDGVPDFVSEEAHPSVVFSRGVGDGTFAAPRIFSAPDWATYTAIADFDGDGRNDIGLTSGLAAGILFGDGTLDAWEPLVLPAAFSAALISADFDGDGLTDLATIQAGFDSSTVRVHLSRPGRTAQTVTRRYREIHADYSCRAAVGDFDRDGLADILVTVENGDHMAVVLRSLGDGTFAPNPIASAPYEAGFHLDVADATGDGLADAVVSAVLGQYFFRGLGNGSFVCEALPDDNTAHRACRFGDVNGDGVQDIVSSNTVGFAVRPGLGNGMFGPPIVTPVRWDITEISLADLNGDERLDAVVRSGTGWVTTALGNGDGTFGRSPTSLSGSAYRVEVADMDGDGDDDCVITDAAGIGVVRSDPGRQHVELPKTPGNFGVFRVADFDEDGRPDVVASLWTGLRVLRNVNGATLVAISDLGTPGVDRLFTGNFSGDGHPDICAIRSEDIVLFTGRGDGTFDPPVATSLGNAFGISAVLGVAIGRLNSDSLSDLCISRVEGVGTGFTEWLWRNALSNGDGTFALQELGYNRAIVSVAVADVNGDGRDDALGFEDLGTWRLNGYGLRTRLQLGDGSFAPDVQTPWIGPLSGVRASDWNGDGVVDLAGHSGGGGWLTYLGSGDGGFVPESGLRADHGQLNDWGLGNLDGDGHPDLVVAGWNLEAWYGRGDLLAPIVSVHAPGSPMAVGQVVGLEWTATDEHSVAETDLFVSRRGVRGPFLPIALGLANTGSHDWTVTGPLSDSVVFKAVARDSAGNVGHAKSSGLRTIVAPVAVADPTTTATFALARPSPNPARGRLSVSFTLPVAANTRLALYDVRGREVARLLDGARGAGPHTVEWRRAARPLPPGLYFLELRAGARRATARVTLLD